MDVVREWLWHVGGAHLEERPIDSDPRVRRKRFCNWIKVVGGRFSSPGTTTQINCTNAVINSSCCRIVQCWWHDTCGGVEFLIAACMNWDIRTDPDRSLEWHQDYWDFYRGVTIPVADLNLFHQQWVATDFAIWWWTWSPGAKMAVAKFDRNMDSYSE